MTTILVIDDDISIRNSLQDALTTVGFNVVTAENTEEGLNIIRYHRPDLILCDVMMPKMTGYDLLEYLQNEIDLTYIPFIFLTGNSDTKEMRRGMEMGADDYLFKPFSIEYLLKAINTRLEKSLKLKQKSAETLKQLRQNISLALPHEVNTPLNGIGASAQLLKDYHDSLSQEDIAEIAGVILESTQRLTRLVQNFLLYAELELISNDDEKIKLLRQDENGCSLLNLVQPLAVEIASKYQRPSDLNLNCRDVTVRMSESHLQKALTELIDNAFKYSEAKQKVKIDTDTSNSVVKLIIFNEGKGMTPEEIEKIGAYMQFQRKKYEQQGSGLGFSIACKLLEIYQGEVTINSVYGEYTQVEILLP